MQSGLTLEQKLKLAEIKLAINKLFEFDRSNNPTHVEFEVEKFDRRMELLLENVEAMYTSYVATRTMLQNEMKRNLPDLPKVN